jgi:hypothetical protein
MRSVPRLIPLLLLLLAVSVGASTNSPIDATLSFKLLPDSAFVLNSRLNSPDTLANIPFQVKWTVDTNVSTLQVLQTRVYYNSSLLTFVRGYKDTANWAGASVQFTDAGTYVDVFMEGGTGYLPTSFTTYAHLVFRIKCQADNAHDTLTFDGNASNNSATRYNGGAIQRSPGSYSNAAAVMLPYIYSMTLGNVTTSSSTDGYVRVPIYANHNFRLYYWYETIHYDTTKLQYMSLDSINVMPTQYFYDDTEEDFPNVRLTIFDNSSHSEMPYRRIGILKFRVKCTQTRPIRDSIYALTTEGSSDLVVWPCYSIAGVGTLTPGIVTIADSAILSGKPSSSTNAVGKTQDTLAYSIQLVNTYVAGYGYNPAVSDSGIVVNFDTKSTRLTVRAQNTLDSIGSLHYLDPGITGGGARVQVVQQWNNTTPADRARDASLSPTTLFRAKLSWNPGGSYVPSWDTQYVYPQFVDTIQALNARFTRVHDTLGCFVAKHVGNPAWLSYGTVSPVKIRMGRFTTGGYYSARCSNGIYSFMQKLYLKTNWFPTGTQDTVCGFRVIVTPPSGKTLSVSVTSGYDIQDSAFSTGAHLIKRESTSSYHGLPSDSVIAQIRVSNVVCNTDCGVKIDSAQYSEIRSLRGQEYVAAPVSSGATLTNCANIQCSYNGKPETDVDGQLPRVFSLDQNYPNPFNPVTRINLNLPVASEWNITIYNLSGQVVKEFNGQSPAGQVSVTWDAGQFASGVYFYKAVAGDFVATRKMILLK